MVIPLIGFGTPMAGPPPAELQHRFRIIRVCILAMVFSIICLIVAGILLNRLGTSFFESLNLILNTIIGSFLMNEDPALGKVYKFFMQTCLQSCQEPCQGGMNCLLPFIVSNLITVVVAMVFTSDLQNITGLFSVMSSLPPVTIVGAVIFLAASVVALTAQMVGAVYGYLAYKEARDLGVTVTPGFWGRNFGAGGSAGTSLTQSVRANDRDTEMN
uniref:Uncharacterized protein n=1 Tax=Noctiluca scintillans TaxID=2966 RepID=A0A7S0ZML2_NOCSC|mmetsp:Transcript_11282/g.31352  ORF Transcript_11282/g.31352 Transcript_11282/m.31352 type:complete len:215 (+) Transcript_11282:78-722(+)